MDPLWSENCWNTFKYFIIFILSKYYILCISWIMNCSIIIDARCKHEDAKWTCRIINDLLCVASRWTIINITSHIDHVYKNCETGSACWRLNKNITNVQHVMSIIIKHDLKPQTLFQSILYSVPNMSLGCLLPALFKFHKIFE